MAVEERGRVNELAAGLEIAARAAGRVGEVNAFAAERATVRLNMVNGLLRAEAGLVGEGGEV